MKNKRKIVTDNQDRLQKKSDALQQKIQGEDFDNISAANAKKLIEELHLYQIELEMQNEKLQEVSQDLIKAVTKYEDLFDFAPVGYVTLDEYGLILEANLTSSRLLATDRRALINFRFSRFIDTNHFQIFANFLTRMVKSETKETCELTFIRPNHSILEARLEGIAIMGRAPEQLQCRVAIIDISEQKVAERRLKESQDFVQNIAFTMPDILTVYDLENRRNLYGNREIETLLGLSPEKIKTLPSQQLLQLVHPEDVNGFVKNMASCRELKDGEVSEFEYRIKNFENRYIWLRVRSVVFQRLANGNVSQILSVQQDVTYRKEAEEELRYKNQIISGLQNNLPIVVSLIRKDGTFESMTGSGLEVLEKMGIGNLTGHNIFEIFPDLRPALETVFFQNQKVSYSYCLGEKQDICFQNYVFLDKTLNAAISFSIDVSEQVKAEKNIAAEREFSQNLLDSSIDGILAIDNELIFTAWNKVMETSTKLSKAEILGRKMFEQFPTFEKMEVGQSVAKVLQGNKLVLHNQEFGIKGANYEVYLNPLFDHGGKVSGALIILHDVKQQKKLEEEALSGKLEKQKTVLNAVLAIQEEERKRIAEALHNGLGQLLYAAKLNLERNAKKNSEWETLLKELLDEAIRETRTISFELMPRILEDFGLETAVSELISRLNKLGLKLAFKSSGLHRLEPTIEIAAYRIIQELLNNIIKHANASDALLELYIKRNKLHMVAKDNGIGFNMDKILANPKGIGLTSIQNRVKLMDGKMIIESKPQEGTTIAIELKVT